MIRLNPLFLTLIAVPQALLTLSPSRDTGRTVLRFVKNQGWLPCSFFPNSLLDDLLSFSSCAASQERAGSTVMKLISAF